MINDFQKNLVQILIAILIVILLKPIYSILLISIVFSYLIFPFKRKINSVLNNNSISSILSISFWITILSYSILILITASVQAIFELRSFLKTPFFVQLSSFFNELISDTFFGIFLSQFNSNNLINTLSSFITNILTSTPDFIINFFLFVFFSFYFLKDADFFRHTLLKNFDKRFEKKIDTFVNLANDVFKGVIFGYLLNALIMGLIIFSSFLLIGAPQPFLFGFISMVFSIVPAFGPSIPLLLGIVYFLSVENYFSVFLLIVLLIVLNFLDNIIRAWFSNKVNKNVYIHPALFVAGLVVGPTFFGFIGLIIGPIIFGILSNISKSF